LQRGLDHGQSSLLAVHFLGLLDATKVEERLAVRLFGAHALAKVAFHGHFQVRAQFRVQVGFEMTPAEEGSETVEKRSAEFAHN
jgi:hypothetical protein